MPTIEIYRVKIEPADAERLLEIRASAVAESSSRSPSCCGPSS